MSEKTQTTTRFILLHALVLCTGFLFMSCAKELPEKSNDDLDNNVFKKKDFESSVVVETQGENNKSPSGRLTVKSANNEVRGFYALNEKRLYPVNLVKGNSKLASFFDNVELEAEGPGQKFEISFKLTLNHLVAYKKARGDESKHLQALKRRSAIPVFQYKVSNYGVVEHLENDLGEKTHRLAFHNRDQKDATHVRIVPTADNRNYAGLRSSDFEIKEQFLMKSKLDGRLLNIESIKAWIEEHDVLNRRKFEKGALLRLVVHKKHLYFQMPVKRSELGEVERNLLSENDPRVSNCGQELAKKTGIESCVLAPRFGVPIEHIKLRPKKDDDHKTLATAEEVTGINHEKTDLLKLKTEERIKVVQLGKDLDLVDENLINKKLIDTDAEYLYVPMTLGTPRKVRVANPFFQGNEKVVKLKWQKDGLEVLEAEKNDNYDDNPHNDFPVLKIPGTHRDLSCQQDNDEICLGSNSDGEGRNSEPLERNFFQADFQNLDVLETNMLDVMTNNSGCITHTNTRLVDYTVENGVINIELEKTYKSADNYGSCIWKHYAEDPEGLSGFSKMAFKTSFFYSLVRLDDVKTAEYKKRVYPKPQHRQFGFFKTYKKKLDIDNDFQREEETYLMNRWAGSGDPENPRVIEYYLSNSYFKDKNKRLLQYTKLGEMLINDSLEKAQADIRVDFLTDLKDHNKSPADLRNNMLVLIDEPLANGLLGYAPTVANPKTGEIVQGHVNMYGGVLKMMSRRIWQSMVDLTTSKERKNSAQLKSLADSQTQSNTDIAAHVQTSENTFDGQSVAPEPREQVVSNLNEFINDQSPQDFRLNRFDNRDLSEKKEILQQKLSERLNKKYQDDHFSHFQKSKVEKLITSEEKRLHSFAKNNAYAKEFLQIAGKAKKLLPGIKKHKDFFKSEDSSLLKNWDELNKAQQKKAMDLMIPYSYLTTFIHEMGHSLGLRHNFAGSFDDANFYTAEEVENHKESLLNKWIVKNDCSTNSHLEICQNEFLDRVFKLEDRYTYSSVMDYGASTLNELTLFGKYDMAALNFGYGSQSQQKSLNTLETHSSPRDSQDRIQQTYSWLKSLEDGTPGQTGSQGPPFGENFLFCTDENAGLSTQCNRFDEGSNLVEITKHKIKKYEDYYKYRNFRDDRNDFNVRGGMGYAVARIREFRSIRSVLEDWELYADILGKELLTTGCNEELQNQYPDFCADIKDRIDAVKLAGDFFINILQTPDKTCAFHPKGKPNQIGFMANLRTLYKEGYGEIQPLEQSHKLAITSCEHPAVKNAFKQYELEYMAQAGKFLNGIRDQHSDNDFASDRSIRGIWIDKAVAMKTLVQRSAELSPSEDTFENLLTANSENMKNFMRYTGNVILNNNFQSGVPFVAEDGQKLSIPYKMDVAYQLQSPGAFFYQGFRDFFDIPYQGKLYLNEVLLGMAHRFGRTEDIRHRDQASLFINNLSVRRRRLGDGFQNTDGLNIIQIGDLFYGASETNGMASGLIDRIKDQRFLQKTDEAKLQEILNKRQEPFPAIPQNFELDELEVQIWETLNAQVLAQILALPAGMEFTVGQVKAYISKENAELILQAYNEKSKEELKELQSARQEVRNEPPQDADEETLRLYEIPAQEIAGYLNSGAENRQKLYNDLVTNLRMLPDHITSR